MKVVIRFSAAEELRAIPIILRHSPGAILPDRTYVVSVESVQALGDERIQFTELSREVVRGVDTL